MKNYRNVTNFEYDLDVNTFQVNYLNCRIKWAFELITFWESLKIWIITLSLSSWLLKFSLGVHRRVFDSAWLYHECGIVLARAATFCTSWNRVSPSRICVWKHKRNEARALSLSAAACFFRCFCCSIPRWKTFLRVRVMLGCLTLYGGVLK